MLAEARVNAAHFIAKTLLEQVLDRARGVKLEIKDGATLETAKDQDHQQSNYQESANHFYSVYELSPNAREKADALIGLSQQLINLQSFKKAREFLGYAPKLFHELPEAQKLLFNAQVEGKLGWIEDYELGYWNELKHFGNAVDFLSKVPRDKLGISGYELYSTAVHFSGRARYWLAAAGVNRRQNITEALCHFEQAIGFDSKLDVLTRDEKIGHGYAWQARCAFLFGEIKEGDELMYAARYHFDRHQKLFPKSAVMAHYFELKGMRDLKMHYLLRAREDFENAIDIRTEKGQYSQGLAVAYLGLAVVALKEGRLDSALGYTVQATKINPLVILRSGIGG